MLLIIPLLTVIIIGTISTSHAEFPSPLRQIQDGTDPADIQCNDGKVHVVRDSGSHACVKETTAERFGWEIVPVKTPEDAVKPAEQDPPKTSENAPPIKVTSSAPCYPGCPQLSFSHLPALGENGTVTLTVGSDGYFLYERYVLENATKNLLVAFYSNPANAVEFPDLELVRVPTEKPWQDPDGDGIREVMTIPFTMSPNQNAVFSTTFKFTQLGKVDFSAQIIDSENTMIDGTGTYIMVGEDSSAIFKRDHAPVQLATDEELEQFRNLINKRGGFGPEILTDRDSDVFVDMIRLEGILNKTEANRYFGSVSALYRDFGEESLSWRELGQARIADDEWLALEVRAWNAIEANPTQVNIDWYHPNEDGQDGWEYGYGTTLDEIRALLARDNYMTQSEIDQYVQDYLADDFADTHTKN